MAIKNRRLRCPETITLIVVMLSGGFETRAFSFSHDPVSGFGRGSSVTSLRKTHGLQTIHPHLLDTRTRNSMEMRMSASSSASSSSSSSAPSSPDVSNILTKTLLSIEECIQVYAANAEKEENNDKEGDANTPIMFVDASWWHKGEFSGPGRGREIFEEGPRIPGSVYVDMDDIAWKYESTEKELPHMLPSPELFAAAMDAFGITNKHHVIIYARDTVFFTPRTWFLFRAMGHDPSKIHLMQGSLEQFIDDASIMGVSLGIENQGRVVVPRTENMNLTLNPKYQVKIGSQTGSEDQAAVKNACDKNKVLDVVNASKSDSIANNSRNTIIVDSRGSSYVNGHIPGSVHIPYASFVSKQNPLKLKPIEEMKKIFADAGIDLDSSSSEEFDIICSCGSGVSACHTFLALELCGRNVDADLTGRTMVYDGSWAEWGSDPNTPKET